MGSYYTLTKSSTYAHEAYHSNTFYSLFTVVFSELEFATFKPCAIKFGVILHKQICDVMAFGVILHLEVTLHKQNCDVMA